MEYRYSLKNQPLLGSGGGPDYFDGVGQEYRSRAYTNAEDDDRKRELRQFYESETIHNQHFKDSDEEQEQEDAPIVEEVRPSKLGCLCSPCVRALEFVSLGSYSTKLYYRRRNDYTTWVGGLITIVLLLVVSLIAYSILVSTVNQDQVVEVRGSKQLETSSIGQLTLGQLLAEGIKLPKFSFSTEMESVNGWEPYRRFIQTADSADIRQDLIAIKLLSEAQLSTEFDKFSIDPSRSFTKTI